MSLEALERAYAQALRDARAAIKAIDATQDGGSSAAPAPWFKDQALAAIDALAKDEA